MKNYNQSINQDLNRIFDLKGENSNEIADFIQPVINIYASPNIIRKGTASNSTSGTIYTTPSDKDFYLTNCAISVTKDATSTSTGSDIQVTINGVTFQILTLATLTLTAQNMSNSMDFSNPIKIDRGTPIQILNATNVANVRAVGNIVGFTTETTKGV
jgi:hypothetical protein